MRDRQFELPIKREILSLNGLRAEWHWGSDKIYEAISDGMPYKQKPNGNFEFNLKECQHWISSGWFESLSEEKQREIYEEYRKGRKSKRGRKAKV